jgi:hypothetical protein
MFTDCARGTAIWNITINAASLRRIIYYLPGNWLCLHNGRHKAWHNYAAASNFLSTFIFTFPFGVNNQQAMFELMGDHLYNQLYQQGAFQPSTGKNKNQPFKE